MVVAEESIRGFVELLVPILACRHWAFLSMAHYDCHLSWVCRSSEDLGFAGNPRAPLQLEVASRESLALAGVVAGHRRYFDPLNNGELGDKGHKPTFSISDAMPLRESAEHARRKRSSWQQRLALKVVSLLHVSGYCTLNPKVLLEEDLASQF